MNEAIAGFIIACSPFLSKMESNENLALGYPGCPTEVHKSHLLYRQGFVLLHDNERKVPLWVAFRLKSDYISTNKREGDFEPDPDLQEGQRAELSDYRGSGYDRGHMAASGDMRRSPSIQKESFYLSNIVPQHRTLNQSLWADIEKKMRDYAKQYGDVYIFVGPVYKNRQSPPEKDDLTIGANRVAIPDAVYRIIVRKEGNGWKALAFMVPNWDYMSGKPMEGYLTSIDAVESATGLDFLSKLPTTDQAKIESEVPASIWR